MDTLEIFMMQVDRSTIHREGFTGPEHKLLMKEHRARVAAYSVSRFVGDIDKAVAEMGYRVVPRSRVDVDSTTALERKKFLRKVRESNAYAEARDELVLKNSTNKTKGS